MVANHDRVRGQTMSNGDIIVSFSDNYFEARGKFLSACAARSLRVESRRNPHAKGPDGEDLFTDIVQIGPANPKRALLLISGTHGVEGYCGSGPQIGFLREGRFDDLPPETGIVIVHAINPYGFAHDRRVNEDNIDLNRNFLDWSKPGRPTSDYGDIHAHVLPDDWDGPAMEAANAALAQYIADHGMPAFQAAISSGQYEHKDGVFYGGAAASWSNTTLRSILTDYLSDVETLAIIDFHTGLGPYGICELITAGPPRQKELAAQWWGADVTDPEAGTSSSAALDGINAMGIAETLPEAKIGFIAAEYGTRDVPTVLTALRADNWLYHKGDVDSAQGKRIKAQIRDAFYPEFDDWKEMIWNRAGQLVDLAIDGITQGERAQEGQAHSVQPQESDIA